MGGGVLSKRPKSIKSAKVGFKAPQIEDWGPFVVIVNRGCALFRRSKTEIYILSLNYAGICTRVGSKVIFGRVLKSKNIDPKNI